MSDQNTDKRAARFQRNADLENVLHEMNTVLEEAGRLLPEMPDAPVNPPIFLFGGARSGTTLFIQWLAAQGEFGYGSNLISRFFKQPYFGVRVQQILTDFDKLGEFGDVKRPEIFQSDLGKTKGTLSPNEFWYFWRRFFHFKDYCELLEEDIDEELNRQFVKEMAMMDHAFGKPVALKAMIMDWHVKMLDDMFPKLLSIQLHRDPIIHMQSFLNARKAFFGNIETWYAFRPMPEFEGDWPETPYHEIAGQVYWIQRRVREAFEQIAPERKLSVAYEDFCKDPESIYQSIREKLAAQGTEIASEYHGVASFPVSDKQKVDDDEWQLLNQAYSDILQRYE